MRRSTDGTSVGVLLLAASPSTIVVESNVELIQLLEHIQQLTQANLTMDPTKKLKNRLLAPLKKLKKIGSRSASPTSDGGASSDGRNDDGSSTKLSQESTMVLAPGLGTTLTAIPGSTGVVHSEISTNESVGRNEAADNLAENVASAMLDSQAPIITITGVQGSAQALEENRENRDDAQVDEVAGGSGIKIHPMARRAGSLAYEAVKESLRLIVRVTDAVPVVKSATQGVLEVFDRFDAVTGIPGELNDLKENLDKLTLILKDNNYRDRLSGLARVFEEKTRIITTKLGRNMGARIIESTEDINFMSGEIRAITFAINIVMMDVSLKTETTASKIHHNALLDKLKYVEGAGFGHEDRQGCVNGTRMLLLADLLTWATEPKTEHVFWLNGMAGTGKTTVAETLCNLLSGKGALGSSFFCSRKSGDRRKISLIFPSLARALAHKYPEFEKQLVLVLQKCLDPTGMDLGDQFKTLLIEPARIAFANHSGSIILAVDALDECEDQQAAEKFLRIILKERSPGCLRFFVTSRPEAKIRNGFSAGAHTGLRLQDIEKHIVKADIRVYLQTSFEETKDLQSGYEGHWPPAELDVIVGNSGILFIYAATSVKYISDDRGDPVERLQKFASLAPPPNAVEAIDQVYRFVLTECFSGIDSDEHSRIQCCLQTAVCAFEPLSVTMYSTLLGMKIIQVRRAFASLHSVVQMPENNDDKITLYHASFLDYLTDANRSKSAAWHVDVAIGHRMITSQCLQVMMSQLYFNVAKATTSYKSNKEQNLEVPYVLEYTCSSWINHVLLSLKGQSTPLPDILASKIEEFLSEKFLFWLEVLSVLDSAQIASVSLFRLYQLVDSLDLKALCRELSMFISKHLVAIQHSTPHIYLSALPWVSPNSILGQKYLPKFSNLPKILDSQEPDEWEPLVIQLLGHTGGIFCAIYSPDGKLIASASEDKTIRVWDAETGQQKLTIAPTVSSLDFVIISVVFSPNSREIIAGVFDTVFVWDIQTGQLKLELLQGHVDHWKFFGYVAISPDSKYIASASSDDSVSVWDARSGKQIHEALVGSLDPILSVTFSSNSLQLISGTKDGSFLCWDIVTGALVYKIQVEDKPYLSCGAFSHDRNYFLGSSPLLMSTKIWNLATKAKEPEFSLHEMAVHAVAFSYDGKYIALGLGDGTVRVCDSYTGTEVLVLSSHYSFIIVSIAFSPNGDSIVFGSGDATVRVWHIKEALVEYYHTREPKQQLISIDQNKSKNSPFTGHSGFVMSVAFSPNSKYIASGSFDGTVGVWNVDTGTLELPFLQHTNQVCAVAWSPDRKLIASGSGDSLIRLWDVETKLLCSELKGHEDMVQCIAFSPDGLYLVSGSTDQTIRLWNIATNKQMCKPMLGHTDLVNSVAYSPDGRLIVSASNDQTLRIWDAKLNASPQLACLRGHDDSVYFAVFTPDGKHIISGGLMTHIIIWDCSTYGLLKELGDPYDTRYSIAVTPDSKYAFCGSVGSILIWDLVAQEKLDLSVNGHSTLVCSLAVSPNGRFVASGSWDCTIKIWDITTLLESNNQKSEHCTLQNYSPIPYFSHDSWYHNKEGLFLWVPPSKLAYIYTPYTHSIIGHRKITIELDKFVHGTEWHTCLGL